jgi:glutamine amidotransferase
VSRKLIGIVDYDVGNHASVTRAFQAIGYRCCTSRDATELSGTDLLVLPGVGAFPAAMSALHASGLVGFVQNWAQGGRPLIGLCLGMQLLADQSLEQGVTPGLGLIPGEVVSLGDGQWHIGWNSLEVISNDPLFAQCDGQSVYFNHSYVFEAPREYQVCVARLDHPFPVGVRRGNVVGLQFHPEKSQHDGRAMLKRLVEGLTLA